MLYEKPLLGATSMRFLAVMSCWMTTVVPRHVGTRSSTCAGEADEHLHDWRLCSPYKDSAKFGLYEVRSLHHQRSSKHDKPTKAIHTRAPILPVRGVA